MKELADYEQEAEVMKVMAMLKLREGELDVHTLNRIVKRIYDLGYFIGRSKGEHYAKQEVTL